MDTENTPPPQVEPWHWSRMLLRNPISLAGMALAIVSLANIFLFVIIDAIALKPSPYIGILAYMVSPAFLVLGLLLMLGGALVERRKKLAPSAFYPRIDLNDRTQRSAVVSFGTFLIVFVMVSTAGSYKAYEFTESVSLLWSVVPHRDESGVHGVSTFAACSSGVRRVPCRGGRNLVREVQTLRQPASICHRIQYLPAAHSYAGAQLAPRPGNLRAVPLAEEILRRATQSLHALRQR